MVESGDYQFLKKIDNPDIPWIFELTNGRFIQAKVYNYIKTTSGIPLTIMVYTDDKEYFDIPWTSIMTIRREKV